MKKMRAGAACRIEGFCIGLLAACFLPQPAAAADGAALEAKSAAALLPQRANFELERASQEARHVADWVVDSRDSLGMPFVIVDKKDAKVFVFDADGKLRGAAPALLGLARGDDSAPGIGDRELSKIRPQDRTTPAGRFVAALSVDAHGKDLLMVDYDLNVSMHRVITTNPRDRRLQRLATPTPLDNRISFGCINVPVKFYDNVVRPAFTGTKGIVYVLPETRSARAVFSSYDVEEHARLQLPGQPVPAVDASEALRQ